MEVQVSDSGTVQDVAITSSLSGSVGSGEYSVRGSVGSRMSIESGPSLSTKFGTGGSAGWGGVKASY
jgi:hypothetical protein